MAQLKLTRQGKVTSSGTLTLQWPSVASQQYWLCAVVVTEVSGKSTPRGTVLVTGRPRFPILGTQPSALLEVGGGVVVSLFLTGLTPTSTVTATVLGGVFNGTPPGTAPTGPSTLTDTTSVTITAKTTMVTITPVVKTVGLYSGRRPLVGTTTAVPLIPPTRSATYFSNLKIGWWLWGTPANNGALIHIGDVAGGVGVTAAGIPAGSPFSGAVDLPWGDAWTVRISGAAGDVANVLAL